MTTRCRRWAVLGGRSVRRGERSARSMVDSGSDGCRVRASTCDAPEGTVHLRTRTLRSQDPTKKQARDAGRFSTMRFQPRSLERSLALSAQMLRAEVDNHASVHDGSTAASLGLLGAPIEGPTHFSQFDPLAVALWAMSGSPTAPSAATSSRWSSKVRRSSHAHDDDPRRAIERTRRTTLRADRHGIDRPDHTRPNSTPPRRPRRPGSCS